MRAGLTFSVVGHVAILGLGLIALPSGPSLEAEDIEALPVELVTVDEVTDLLAGIKTSELPPEEEPQPIAEIEAEAPAPEPLEAPAEAPVETVEAPPPEPEPAPEPEPELADVEPEPEPRPLEPEAEPEPRVITNPNVPRARPEPPRDVARVEPPRPPAEPQEEEREFNTDDIAALLNKQDPSGGGDPNPVDEPQTIGSIDGRAEAAMTQSEIGALKARLYRCWNPPIAVQEAGSLVVEVRIDLLEDGSLARPPVVKRVEQASDPRAQVAVEAALRAVVQCAPFGDILRPETYTIWNRIDFVFDPREMLGG